MKNFLRLNVVVFTAALLLLSSLNTSAQDTIRGEVNLLSNGDFTSMEEYPATNAGDIFTYPTDWVVVSDSAGEKHPLWGWPAQYALFRCVLAQWERPYPTITAWTGVESEGSMYQNIFDLDNGLYEFELFISVYSLAGSDSHVYMYATNYGGDSVSVEAQGITTAGYERFRIPVNVTNNKCRVGIHVKLGLMTAGADMIDPFFRSLEIVPSAVKTTLALKISAYSHNGMLTVKYNEGEINGVEVFNTSGQLVSASTNLKTGTYNQYLKNSGLYLVKVHTSKGDYTTKVLR